MRDGISDDHHQQGSSAWGKPSAHPGFMNWYKSHGEVINSNPQIQMDRNFTEKLLIPRRYLSMHPQLRTQAGNT